MHSILLQKSYLLFCHISTLTTKFPKKERHTLGIRLDDACLTLMETILEIEQTLPVLRDRALITATIKNDFTKLLLRAAMERKLIKETQYFIGAGLMDEIGKLIGGWRKSITK